MELLDLNLESIQYIYDNLTPVSAAMFASTCSSLCGYYPYKAKHIKLMKPVFDNINALDYKIVDPINNMSQRISGKAIVHYEYEQDYDYDEIFRLVILYDFPNIFDDYNPNDCIFDGGYVDIAVFRKFRTKVDRSMWYAEFGDSEIPRSIHRRRIPNSMTLQIYMNRWDYKQEIYLVDAQLLREDIDQNCLPPWADKPV